MLVSATSAIVFLHVQLCFKSFLLLLCCFNFLPAGVVTTDISIKRIFMPQLQVGLCDRKITNVHLALTSMSKNVLITYEAEILSIC